MSRAPVRTLAAWLQRGIAVALLVGIVSGCGNPSGSGTARQATPTPTSTPVLGVATPGPQAHFVPMVVTASGVSPNYTPINPTADFAVGSPVYLFCDVRNVPSGQSHLLSVYWFLRGNLHRSASQPITGNETAYFSDIFSASGVGMVEVYWDAPNSGSGAVPDGRFLAQSIAFLIA